MRTTSRVARWRGAFARIAPLVVLAATSATARADLVFEAYVGDRPADADRYMTPLREILLQELGVDARPAYLLRQLKHVPYPGVADPSIASAQIVDQIELGYRSSLKGDFLAAAQTLTAALALAHDNPAPFVVDPNARTEMTRALVALGISRDRTNDEAGAQEAFAELARVAAGQPLHGYGKESERLFGEVNEALTKQPRGKLLVAVSDPDAQIFVDENGVGRGGTFSADVIPGPYRIVILASGRSLRYDVEVRSNRVTKVELDWELENMIATSDAWVGLRLASAPTMELARKLSRRSNREQIVILLGLEHICGRVAIRGARFNTLRQSADGGGIVFLGDHDAVKLRALARYLVKQESSREVLASDRARSCGARDTEQANGDAAQPLRMRYALGALGGFALLGGGFAIKFGLDTNAAADELASVCAVSCTSEQARALQNAYDDARRNAIIAGSLGGLALAGGVALFLYTRHTSAGSAIVIAPNAGGASAVVRWSF